jgi:adenylosuccinate lyase
MRVMNVLAGIAASASKMGNDIRLLQHTGEMCEAFGKDQVGSSAMAYKKNPITSEKIVSLSRYVMVNALNPAITAATQWLERSLDDSANKRVVIPEMFLAIDEVLESCQKLADGGLVVNMDTIQTRLINNMARIVTENEIMKAVKNGGNRQEEHEKIRKVTTTCEEVFNKCMNPKDYTGLAADQVENYLNSLK